MALGYDIAQYERNVTEHNHNVAKIELQRRQALPRAQAQLAVLATHEAQRGEPIDVTLREGFNPESPESVLNSSELENFDGAKLVIDAISQHIHASNRLITQRKPYRTTPGRI
jgi:hypothetical protein